MSRRVNLICPLLWLLLAASVLLLDTGQAKLVKLAEGNKTTPSDTAIESLEAYLRSSQQLQQQQQQQQQQASPSSSSAAAVAIINKSNAAANFKRQSQQQQQQQQQQVEKICIGTSNRLSGQHNKTDHFLNLAERYRNCTYVMGNLEITWIDRTSSPNRRQPDLSFLESIREITGYLLIAYVDLDRIRMPNLQIIRGRDLFKIKNNEEYAMFLMNNEIRNLELPNLREILAGDVGVLENKNLCHLRSINWDEILNWPQYKPVFAINGAQQPSCPPCHESCGDNCWSEAADMCQKFSKTTCSPQCSNGRCFGSEPRECCHLFCAAGCTGPLQTDCLACKHFNDDGECIQECPSMQRYNPITFGWEPNPKGKYAFGAKCVKECPEHLLRDNNACVRTCPPGKQSKNGECQACPNNVCAKNCQGVEVVHSGNIEQLINCTVIEGSITILDTSFTGYMEVLPNNTMGTFHAPMSPSKLEVFQTVTEITGYLNIQASHPDFKDLAYFKNLKTIGGRQTDIYHALSVIKTSLVSLNLRSLKKVRSGKIAIEENKELCFADTIDWNQLNIAKKEDIIIKNNADQARCWSANLRCHEECAPDGCWGQGPEECISCNNYRMDDYCVRSCQPKHTLGFLSYDAGNRLCKKCHSECRLGCKGVEAKDCLECKNVKDGPHCVAQCPSHKYNNQGRCEECHKSCLDGCSGPSNRLGQGGCNACSKAVINSTEPAFVAHCIKVDETCPDGYYQEYLRPQKEGPLKSSFGMPICRKCHNKCKSCTGMGSHVSVCECAKFVAGEQCEDFCPRDYFADNKSKQCIKCSPECNGCLGPTEADCITCRVYRIYYETYSGAGNASNSKASMGATASVAGAAAAATSNNNNNNNNIIDSLQLAIDSKTPDAIKFNCTAQCPPDKPHRITEINMLDPYCSEEPSYDADNLHSVTLSMSTKIILFLIISASIPICVFVHRSQMQKMTVTKLTSRMMSPNDDVPICPSNAEPNMHSIRCIPMTQIKTGKLLGKGFGGEVLQGIWTYEGRDLPVAVKYLRDNGYTNKSREFLDEAYNMASLDHKNLVRLFGISNTKDDLILVTPYMALGCLLNYVREYKDSINARLMLEWCRQIASGMAYLEEKRMVHRDLALRNVLLRNKWDVKISDFGLAKYLDTDQNVYHSGGGRMPVKWLAPECIKERKFTHKSDVWAFGVTLWELLTFGAIPYEDCDAKDLLPLLENGGRLQHPPYVATEVVKVMFACWFYRSDERPNFAQLVENFDHFAKDPSRYFSCTERGIDLNRPAALDTEDGFATDEADSLAPDEEVSFIPELTPTIGRGRMQFNFDLPRQQHHSESDATLSTASFKKLPQLFHQQAKNPIGEDNEDVFTNHNGFHEMMNKSHQHLISADQNNNTTFMPINGRVNAGDSCLSMNHTISTNSIGQKSEQPTDFDDYLMPSPCNSNSNNEFKFKELISRHDASKLIPKPSFSQRDPPHSAGLIGISNDEYFLTQANYVNSKTGTTKASSGHIPHSLV